MTYGGTPPAIVPGYGGFVNGDSPASLTTAPTCSTRRTSASPVSGSPYSSSCTGAVDPNYSFAYVPGSVTVNQAASPSRPPTSMTYGSTPPAITPLYSGFVNGDTASSLTTKPTCSTTATSASPVAGSPYSSSCSGAVDPNYAIAYAPGSVTVTMAPAHGHGLERVHDLRQHAAGRHRRLQRLQERRHPVLADHTADVLHHRHQLQPGLAPDLPDLLLGRLRSQLRHLVRRRRASR